MVQLDKALFCGETDNITEEDIVKVEVTNFEDAADRALGKFHWKGRAAACVGLSLSPDNRKVHEGFLITRGKFETAELQLEAKNIWREASGEAFMTIKLPPASMFCFSEGGMVSDYVSAEEVVHFFHLQEEDGALRPVLTAKLPELGIGGFCLRLSCQLSRSSTVVTGVWLKYTLLIFPEKKETILRNHKAAKSPAWPGMKLSEGEIAVLPRPSEAWKCPILPLLWPGTPFDQLPVIPTGEEMRRAVGAIFNRSCEPSVHKTPASLAAKWEKLDREKEEPGTKAGPVTWPKTKEPASETGWSS
jgi:hypothetical protein